MTHRAITTLVSLLLLAGAASAQSPRDRFPSDGPLSLSVETLGSDDDVLLRGFLEVAENRAETAGRRIRLHVVVLPARRREPRADPVFWLAGGPGQAAASLAPMFVEHWLREERDLVFVDQRGTGRSNPLHVKTGAERNDLAGLLAAPFDPERFRAALPELEKRADLRCYTSSIAADDLDEVRRALGYEQVNLMGGSYGTRMALVYMRQYRAAVRSAVLDGVAPIAFENPLHHARSAQEGFDRLVAECEANERTRTAYPDLRGDLARVLERLDAAPAKLELDGQEVELSRDGFTSALRVMLYYEAGNRSVPRLLQRAARGDLEPFARAAVQSNRALRDALALGMLMCVTSAEDLARIDEDEIVRECAGTFLGEIRVRAQLAIAAFWPRGTVPAGWSSPVAVEVPTLLLSGTHDPVTPPRWGEEAASHLPRSEHVVVQGCHGVGGHPRVQRLIREFLDAASVDGLDLDGIADIRMAPIELPGAERR
ncbi:MAG: alpha/beta fold hydrolase [Planctomycetes bacterium]|nr:alpha/beta fold hydrolase [Planctomycetota bacterium]